MWRITFGAIKQVLFYLYSILYIHPETEINSMVKIIFCFYL